MNDWTWHPDPTIPLHELYKRALELGHISSAKRWNDQWEVVIEIGDWTDIQVRCVGRAADAAAATALAYTKARWIKDRLDDYPNL